MQRQQAVMALPTKVEAEKIIPIIRSEFGAAGIAAEGLGISSQGGVVARATVPAERKDALVCALFGHGIVPVEIRAGEWGFAVRR